MDNISSTENQPKPGLSSAKREDIWALIIAGIVMVASMAAPESVYTFFNKVLFLF
jgi:hypothetical protein